MDSFGLNKEKMQTWQCLILFKENLFSGLNGTKLLIRGSRCPDLKKIKEIPMKSKSLGEELIMLMIFSLCCRVMILRNIS